MHLRELNQRPTDISMWVQLTARLSNWYCRCEQSTLHAVLSCFGTNTSTKHQQSINIFVLNHDSNNTNATDDNDEEEDRGSRTDVSRPLGMFFLNFLNFYTYDYFTDNLRYATTTVTPMTTRPKMCLTRLDCDMGPQQSWRRVKTHLNDNIRPRRVKTCLVHDTRLWSGPRCGRGGRDEDTGPNNETGLRRLALGASFFFSLNFFTNLLILLEF